MDHQYKASWLGPRGDKSCKICGRGRGAHWTITLVETSGNFPEGTPVRVTTEQERDPDMERECRFCGKTFQLSSAPRPQNDVMQWFCCYEHYNRQRMAIRRLAETTPDETD